MVLAKACLLYKNTLIPFGWQSYSFVENYMHGLGQGVFYFTRITLIPFGWQSYSFVEKYMLSLTRGMFYSTTWLPFGWQSYSFVEKYMHNLGQGLFELTKIARLPFGWQSYSFIEKYLVGLSQGDYLSDAYIILQKNKIVIRKVVRCFWLPLEDKHIFLYKRIRLSSEN